MMATSSDESISVVQQDPYRSFIYGEGEKNTVWRTGSPPNYELVNKLFEQGRTNIWAKGTLEEKVQRIVKTWEMERVNKLRPQDYKSIDPEAFSHSVNGTPKKNLAEMAKIGGYNQFLQTSLPEHLRAYDPSKYTVEQAQNIFLNAFPRGFALEILQVYSAPPKIVYKFRHWSFMDGPFQGHAPTGELVQLIGISIFTVDESTMKVGNVEFFHDPGELIGDLLKGPLLDGSEAPTKARASSHSASGCPVINVTETAAGVVQVVQSDPYRSFIYGQGEKDTVWRNGAPPNYEVVNKLFEEGRTNVWEPGSVEEKVQRLLKSWEMELFHKVRPQDYKTLDVEAFSHSVNGTAEKSLAEVQQIGGYNQFLQTSLPEDLRAYDPSKYTAQESSDAFLKAFPRGFAIEILEVYSGPPEIAFKFRHWSFMDGPFQGHAPTGELVQLIGISIFSVDESTMKIGKVEFFYDPGELIGDLLKGPLLDGSEAPKVSASVSGCPFISKLQI